MTNPGLDIHALRALRPSIRNQAQIHARILQHLEHHDGYLALSGGKDSLVVLDLVRQVDPNVPVVFFDSGLEFPETHAYIDELRQRWRLNLHTIQASPTLLNILATNGTWNHRAREHPTPDLHQVLIANPSRQAHREHGPGELWGVRAAESKGRRTAYSKALSTVPTCPCCRTTLDRLAAHGGVISRTDGTVAYGPIWDWTDTEVWAHIAARRLPLNPVYQRLRQLGADEHALRISHVLDAGLLESGRIVWLKRGWPDLYERLRAALPRLSEFI